MSENVLSANAPACTGCHFGCTLDAYRCGRGKAFYELWQAGGEVPERRGPGRLGGSPGGDHRPPSDTRVMHALTIMTKVLHERHAEAPESKLLASIERQGGFFALDKLAERAVLTSEEPAM